MSVVAAFAVPHPPIVIPEVGRGEEIKIRDTARSYDAVAAQIEELKPDTIVVISPHSVMYGDYIHISPGSGASGSLKQFGVPTVNLYAEYDTEMVGALERKASNLGIPAGRLGERDKNLDHGTIVPLYFINKRYTSYRLVRMSISGLNFAEHYEMGKCIQSVSSRLGRRVVIVASGDLSHRLLDSGPYDYAPEGPEFDRQVTEAMKQADFLKFMTFSEDFCEAAGECGLRAFIIMAGALDRKSVKTEFMSYEGPFGVGYAVCGYHVMKSDASRNYGAKFKQMKEDELKAVKEAEDDYVRLARLSLETFIREHRMADVPADIPAELKRERAGVFVSLKKDGRLRGCIGTILPTQGSIAEEIINNAVSSGVGDTRFEPVSECELDDIVYSVDVLKAPEPISSMDELNVEKYGVIVTSGGRRGLLLPNLEGVTTVKQQVEIALQKAGISKSASYSMERFEVVRHV